MLLLFLMLMPMLGAAQQFDGHTVYWPEVETPAHIQSQRVNAYVFSESHAFELPVYEDSIRLRYGDVDTVLVAPWLVPGSTSVRDGIYNLYGMRIGAVTSPVPIPGIYLVSYRGKVTMVPRFEP